MTRQDPELLAFHRKPRNPHAAGVLPVSPTGEPELKDYDDLGRCTSRRQTLARRPRTLVPSLRNTNEATSPPDRWTIAIARRVGVIGFLWLTRGAYWELRCCNGSASSRSRSPIGLTRAESSATGLKN